MPYHCVLKAQLHRPRYIPGDVVKASFTVLCTDRITASDRRKGGGLVPFVDDLSRLEERPATLDARGTPAVTVIRVAAQFVGSRVTDKSRIKSAGLDEDESFVQLVASPDALPGHEEPHCIFTSGVAAPIQNQPMQLHQHASACISCALPPSLPPSYRGQCARFYYGIYFSCIWESGGQTSVTTLRVPIRVTSPIAAITTLRAPYASVQRPLEIRSVILPPLPTPAISPPLSDQLLSREPCTDSVLKDEGQRLSPPAAAGLAGLTGCGAPSAFRASGAQFVAHTLRCTINEQSVATEYTIRHNQTPTLGLVLLSTAVQVGETLRGVFTTMPNNETCCCRVTVSIESFETVPRDLFQPGSIIPSGSRKDERGEDLVVTQSKVVEEQEFFLCNAAQVPLDLHLSPLKYTQTMRTDVVSLSWVLRFKFWNCAAMELTKPGATAIRLLSGFDELEVPLTLFSPLAVENPRIGPVHYAA